MSLEDRRPNPSTYTDDFIYRSKLEAEAKGARYRTIEKEVRNKFAEEMKAEEERERQLEQGDPETAYLSEAKEKYAVPGFTHQVPEPKFVISWLI